MIRPPRKPARVQPPLRGRAATRAQMYTDPERPNIKTYQPPAKPPFISPGRFPSKLTSSKPASPGKTLVPSAPLPKEPVSISDPVPEKWLGGLAKFWMWTGLLVVLLVLWELWNAVLGI